jgi:hypothetical protein
MLCILVKKVIITRSEKITNCVYADLHLTACLISDTRYRAIMLENASKISRGADCSKPCRVSVEAIVKSSLDRRLGTGVKNPKIPR